MIDYFKNSDNPQETIEFDYIPHEVCLIYEGYRYQFYSPHFRMYGLKLKIFFSLSQQDAEFWAIFLERRNKYNKIKVLDKDGLYCVIGIK